MLRKYYQYSYIHLYLHLSIPNNKEVKFLIIHRFVSAVFLYCAFFMFAYRHGLRLRLGYVQKDIRVRKKIEMNTEFRCKIQERRKRRKGLNSF